MNSLPNNGIDSSLFFFNPVEGVFQGLLILAGNVARMAPDAFGCIYCDSIARHVYSRKILCGFGNRFYSPSLAEHEALNHSALRIRPKRSPSFQRYVFSTLTMISPDMVCPRTGRKVGKIVVPETVPGSGAQVWNS